MLEYSLRQVEMILDADFTIPKVYSSRKSRIVYKNDVSCFKSSLMLKIQKQYTQNLQLTS